MLKQDVVKLRQSYTLEHEQRFKELFVVHQVLCLTSFRKELQNVKLKAWLNVWLKNVTTNTAKLEQDVAAFVRLLHNRLGSGQLPKRAPYEHCTVRGGLLSKEFRVAKQEGIHVDLWFGFNKRFVQYRHHFHRDTPPPPISVIQKAVLSPDNLVVGVLFPVLAEFVAFNHSLRVHSLVEHPQLRVRR